MQTVLHNANVDLPAKLYPALSEKPSWYALYTRNRHEKLVHRELEGKGIESFLPLRRIVRQWSDRKKLIEEPLFRGYLFLRIDLAKRMEILSTTGVVSIVGSHCEDPWIVPEKDIEALQRFVEKDLRIDPFPYLKEGSRVRVLNGPLEDVEGFIVRKQSQCRLVISVEMMLQSVTVEIDGASVEPI